MKEFIVSRPKIYMYLSYLTDDDCVDKKTKVTKRCAFKNANLKLTTIPKSAWRKTKKY